MPISPLTSNLKLGSVSLMPTLPPESTVNLCVLLVPSANSLVSGENIDAPVPT